MKIDNVVASLPTSSLEANIRPHLLKLKARLAKLGIRDVTHYDYESYLRSTLWQSIREWVYARDNFTCLICGDKKVIPIQEFDVHHRSYDLATMEGRDDRNLATLCRRCHNKVEHYSDGRRRFAMDEKEDEYARLKALHAGIVANGLEVQVSSQGKRGCTTHVVTYSGPPEYLEFYEIDSIARTFAIKLWTAYREQLKFPRHYGSRTFREPAGGTFTDKISGKRVLQIKCADNSASIHTTRACALPVADVLLMTIEDDELWRLASNPPTALESGT